MVDGCRHGNRPLVSPVPGRPKSHIHRHGSKRRRPHTRSPPKRIPHSPRRTRRPPVDHSGISRENEVAGIDLDRTGDGQSHPTIDRIGEKKNRVGIDVGHNQCAEIVAHRIGDTGILANGTIEYNPIGRPSATPLTQTVTGSTGPSRGAVVTRKRPCPPPRPLAEAGAQDPDQWPSTQGSCPHSHTVTPPTAGDRSKTGPPTGDRS